MTLRYRIGPCVVELQAPIPPHDPGNLYFRPFEITTPEPADLTLLLQDGPPPGRSSAQPIAELTDHWRLYKEGSVLRLEILEQVELQTRLVALIDQSWKRITVYLMNPAYSLPSPKGWSLSGTMDPLVQWWMTARFAEDSRGLVLHAAAVSFDGHGTAFIGRSGAGKSTMAGWCHGRAGLTVLNDERILLWEDRGRWFVSGTPWSGDLAQASGAVAPLARLHLLVQSTVNDYRPLSPRASLFRLLEEASLPTWDPERSANAVATAARMLGQIPCGELLNRREPEIVDFLRQSLRESAAEAAV